MLRKIQMEVFWFGIRGRGHKRISVREGAPIMVSACFTVYPGVSRFIPPLKSLMAPEKGCDGAQH